MPHFGTIFRLPLTARPTRPSVEACIDQHGQTAPLETFDAFKDAPSTPPSDVEPNPLPYQYIIVRSDLPPGVLAAHVGHAASEAAGHPPTAMVVLDVPDEQALMRIADALGEKSLTYKLIVEDAGPFAGQATAIGVVPCVDRTAVRKATSHLPLVGKTSPKR